MALLKLENVWKRYGEVEAVKNVNLECEQGEFLSLLGPSGCGKTSTLRMIAGLEKITSGNIYIKGQLVNDLQPGKRNIAMAFENYALYPTLVVYENIAFPLRAKKLSEKEIKKRVLWVAELLEIEDILYSKPKGLSGGQQQRISLARALVKDADIHLMDEPISHLDADMRRRMRRELKRLHQTTGMTVVYVTHDQLEAMSMADRIAVMNNGVIHQIGTPTEIFNHPKDEFVAGFIGSPPINFLESRLRVEKGRYAIEVEKFLYFIPDRLGKKVEKASDLLGGRVRLGVRPGDIALSLKKVDNALSGKVILVEPVGESVVYHIRLGEKEIIAEVSVEEDINVSEGEGIRIIFNPDRLYFFHPETGKSLHT
ncbi:ABC transporter ATP-binding protein [Candidatus Aerophobetes bacterium]|nr:ABC transporter ATP-binding protein [Candidatus Aerophobetes bacterium]